MNRKVGVIATVGPDPGLTEEERAERNRRQWWQSTLRALESKLAQIETRIQDAQSPAVEAALRVKAEAVIAEIERARRELLDASDPAN